MERHCRFFETHCSSRHSEKPPSSLSVDEAKVQTTQLLYTRTRVTQQKIVLFLIIIKNNTRYCIIGFYYAS